MKNKIILVGAINEGGVATCGETMKNQLFVKRFNELFDKVITVDTINWKKRPWVLVRLLFVLLAYGRKYPVIISACPISVNKTIYITNRLFKRARVHYWVIGGNLQDYVKRGEVSSKELQKLCGVYVEGNTMKVELEKQDLTNVSVVPNFKPITYTPTIEPKKDGEMCRFVFLSRVHPDKGIGEILAATKQLNAAGLQQKFEVDFYGKIEPAYEDRFRTEIAKVPNANYKGFLDLTNNEGYDTLSKYDVMLFPTYWGGEGFPGVVIDANMSGLPIIASDWNMNKEVVVDGQTGFIIPVHDSNVLAAYMRKIINKEVDLVAMKRYCVDYIQKYDYHNILSEELMKNILEKQHSHHWVV